MTYAFRKYLNKRGSALFMVLSLMTALMILVMAMYFSVVSSRDVQYKVFYQEQAYRSATSLSDAMVAGLKNQSWQTEGTSLLDAILALDEEGDFITTNGNDFKAFVADGTKEEQDQLGAYTVTITRMKDEKFDGKTTRVFDIAITTSSGGVLDTTHTYIHVAEPESETSQGKTTIFTSTGYVPNDVHLIGVKGYTDLFYDNEFVVLKDNCYIYSNLSCGGSLEANNVVEGPGSLNNIGTWAIRNHFTSNYGGYKMAPDGKRGLILVGGDFTMNGNISNADVYVLGNAYYKNGNFNNSRLFVNGELRSVGSSSPPSADIYASGKGEGISINLKGNWKTGENLPSGVMSVHDMAQKLDQMTASNDYFKWEINDDAPNQDYFVKELYEDGNSCDPLTIEFNENQFTYYLDWKDGYQIKDYFGDGEPLNYTPYVIEDIKSDWSNVNADTVTDNAKTCATIIIDTGDDEKNQVLLKVLPNRDRDDDNINETFEWFPSGSGAKAMTVLIRGKGSVVIDIPDGVIYQASSDTSVMHETWFALFGGKTLQQSKTDSTNKETLAFLQNGDAAFTVKPLGNNEGGGTSPVLNFIHTDCNEDCGCKYEVKTTGTDKCSECKGSVTTITCEEHKMTYSFCPECHSELEPENNNGKYYGLCLNRIDRPVVKDAVEDLGEDWLKILKASGDGENWYYPHTNIFLVSCDESADIRLAASKSFTWGFVYAPYMTYKGTGNGADWAVFGGGMIVADYVIKNFDAYLACYPDMLPEDLMNEKNRNEMLDAIASKSWKISLAGY